MAATAGPETFPFVLAACSDFDHNILPVRFYRFLFRPACDLHAPGNLIIPQNPASDVSRFEFQIAVSGSNFDVF